MTHIKAISSASNPEFKAFKAFHKIGSPSFVVEGKKLIEVAIQAGFSLDSYWITDASMVDDFHIKVPVRLIPEKLYPKISPTKNSKGPLGVFKKKKPKSLFFQENAGRFLLLDSIQDPGNAGALVRAGKAFGLDGIIWYGTTLNLYHHALIRASAGASFLIQHYKLDMTSQTTGFQILGTVAKRGISLDKFSWPKSFILCLGNEGHGLSESIEEICTENISIPIQENVESLNVAGAGHVLLYMAQRNI